MQKTLSFLLLLFINFLFSQSYHFDYFVEDTSRETSNEENPWIRNYFYDSKSGKKLHLRNYENGFLASLYDKESQKSHYFYVSKEKSQLTFTYAYSFEHEVSKTIKDINKNDDIEVFKIDSLNYKVNIFKDKQKRKKKYAMDILIEKSPVDFFEIPMEYSRSEEVIQRLKSYLCCDQKYMTKSSDFTNFKYKETSRFEITKFEKTDLTLVLPEKLKIDVPFWNK